MTVYFIHVKFNKEIILKQLLSSHALLVRFHCPVMPFWYVFTVQSCPSGTFLLSSHALLVRFIHCSLINRAVSKHVLARLHAPTPYQALPPTGQAYEPTAPPSSLKNNLTGIAGGQKGSPQCQPLANSAPQHSPAGQHGKPPQQ